MFFVKGFLLEVKLQFHNDETNSPRSMELVLVLMTMCYKVSVWFRSYLLQCGNPFYNCLCSALVDSLMHEPVNKCT